MATPYRIDPAISALIVNWNYPPLNDDVNEQEHDDTNLYLSNECIRTCLIKLGNGGTQCIRNKHCFRTSLSSGHESKCTFTKKVKRKNLWRVP